MSMIKTPPAPLGDKSVPASGNAKGAFSDKKVGQASIKTPAAPITKK